MSALPFHLTSGKRTRAPVKVFGEGPGTGVCCDHSDIHISCVACCIYEVFLFSCILITVVSLFPCLLACMFACLLFFIC